MLEFPAQDGIEVYASVTGNICFKSTGDLAYDQDANPLAGTFGFHFGLGPQYAGLPRTTSDAAATR